MNGGAITVVGTSVAQHPKGGNPEGGSALVLGNSIAGGFLNNGPATANGSAVTAAITGNGATVSGIAYPALLIDPSQTVTATNATIRGPIVFGVVPSSVDPVDGATATNAGYGFINRGRIQITAENLDVGTTTLIIDGASPTNTTTINGGIPQHRATITGRRLHLGEYQFGHLDRYRHHRFVCVDTPHHGAGARKNSSVSATPELPSSAVVSGPGGGSICTALGILDQAHVPEIDVLQHGSIVAQIATSTVSPTADVASTKTPFTQNAVGIVDASGNLKTINNAGAISALTTFLTPAPEMP